MLYYVVSMLYSVVLHAQYPGSVAINAQVDVVEQVTVAFFATDIFPLCGSISKQIMYEWVT